MRFKTFLESSSGTYVALKVIGKSFDELTAYIEEQGWDPAPHGLHCTVMFSRNVLTDFKPNKRTKYKANPIRFELFGKCLVLQISSPSIDMRHRELMSQYDATYDHSIFKPHITLAKVGEGYDWGNLPIFNEEILLGEEYSSALEL